MTIEYGGDEVMFRNLRWAAKLQAQHLEQLSKSNDNLDIKGISRKEKKSLVDMLRRRFS